MSREDSRASSHEEASGEGAGDPVAVLAEKATRLEFVFEHSGGLLFEALVVLGSGLLIVTLLLRGAQCLNLVILVDRFLALVPADRSTVLLHFEGLHP